VCGIAGFIGESKNSQASFAILSKLFSKVEIRGVDAAGYWMAETGNQGRIFYHKQPGKSSDLVKSDTWKANVDININLALVHARGASRGYGDPLINKNNHPFVNQNKNVALIHNGKIHDDEYVNLLSKYQVKTDCDSEILLRIFEYAKWKYSKEDLDKYVGQLPYAHRMAGIKDIFSVINHGHMAVAIGEYDTNNNRCLWLFRNEHRPLWAVDLRSSLGQIFFVSEPSIWYESINELSEFSHITKIAKICEIPEEELWYFHVNNDNNYASVPMKFSVVKSEPKLWIKSEPAQFLDDDDISVDVVTSINDDVDNNIICNHDEIFKADILINSIEKEIAKIHDVCKSICISSQVLIRNNTLSISEAEQILSLLEEQNRSIKTIDGILS